jgi:hypothetical protein
MRKRALTFRLGHRWPKVQIEAMADLALQIQLNSIEEGECLLWKGRTSDGGVPRLGDRSLRRLLYEAAVGEVPAGMLTSTKCGNPECLNPAHLCLKTRSKVLIDTYATSDLAIRRAAASTRESRKKAKLTIEAAREIRMSDETLDVMAARFGVHRTLCSQIRRGVAWKEANPFTGLGARG